MCECKGSTSIISQVGPQGDVGAIGPAGPAGSQGVAGKGTLLLSGYTGATAIAGDMYNAAAGYTWGTGVTVSGITGNNTALINVNIQYTLANDNVTTLTILLNGTPSGAVYNIRKTTDVTGFRNMIVTGELSNLANGDVITFKAAVANNFVSTLTNGYISVQIFQ